MRKFSLIQNLYTQLRLRQAIALQYQHYCVPVQFQQLRNVKFYSTVSHDFVRFTHTEALKCWNCGTVRKLTTSLTCDQCNVLQEPHENKNYFRVLDVQENFDVDPKALTTKYRKLQAVLHPDKFSNKSEKEKTISANYSALVNKAYNTLQIPLNRAIHMLRLRGEEIEEDQKVTDPQLLMEIMELNEEVEAAHSPEQLKKLNQNNKKVLEELGQEVANYFRENQIDKAKESVIKMKYYNSVSSHINGLLRERGIVD